jgi:hypothetical protein
MKTTTNTAAQNDMAREILKGANEKIAAGQLWIGLVQVKEITRSNADKVFPPGVREIVRRYLGCQSVTL